MSDLERLNEIFDGAVALSGPALRDYLDRACGTDAELRSQIERLLEQDARTTGPLDTPLEDVVAGVLPDRAAQVRSESTVDESAETLGRLGAYELVRTLGSGGMGTVFEAVRADGDFEQRVAIKRIKLGMDSEHILARFRSERRILARLEHPGIARLLDGGVAEDGRPYLVMEYVDGVAITDYADQAGLTPDRRLGLFRQVASAVAFAHRNLIVHRDLKPSNILVRADGSVKLLDFGIAKLLAPTDLDDALTRTGVVPLTPAYAAPEQVAGEPVTTGSDVFSLGVVLHELLTGYKPLWKGDDPVAPSTVVSTVFASDTDLRPEARHRGGVSLERLRSLLQGDLDAVLMKALERDPSRRYSTVDALLDDIERVQSHRPVSARRATPMYYLSRFARRHRAGVAAGVVGLTALGVGSALVVEQRNVARAERDAAEAVTSYLEDLFGSVNPVGQDPGADTLRVVDFLDRSVERAMSELADEPGLRARLIETLGRAHYSLGDFETASELWDVSERDYREAGAEVPASLTRNLGEVAVSLGEWERADSILGASLVSSRVAGDEAAELKTLALQARGLVIRDRTLEAEPVLDQLLPLARKLSDTQRLADALYLRAAVAMERSDAEAAISFMEEGVDAFRATRGPGDPQVAIGLTNLASIYRRMGRLDEAESRAEAGVQALEGRVPTDHPILLNAWNTWATVLGTRGELERADSLYTHALGHAQGPAAWRARRQLLFNHAANRRDAGDLDGMLALMRESVAVSEQALGEDAPGTTSPLIGLGQALDAVGDSTAAEAVYERAVRAAGDVVPPTETGRMIAEVGAARGLSRRGSYAQAESRLQSLLDRTDPEAPVGGDGYRMRERVLREMVANYTRWGRTEDAVAAQAQLEPGP